MVGRHTLVHIVSTASPKKRVWKIILMIVGNTGYKMFNTLPQIIILSAIAIDRMKWLCRFHSMRISNVFWIHRRKPRENFMILMSPVGFAALQYRHSLNITMKYHMFTAVLMQWMSFLNT